MKKEQYSLSFCGDSFLLADYGQIRSVPAGIKAVMLMNLIREHKVKGAVDMVPCNTSLLIRFDPNLVRPEEFRAEIKKLIDQEIQTKDNIIVSSRIVELPVLFADPWTKEAIEEYCRTVTPKQYDVDFIIEQNHLSGLDELIRYLSTPYYLVVYLSVGPGLPSTVCMDPDYVLSVPKYNPPRTSTPPLSIGLGGSNVSLYTTASPGGYQLFGMLPTPLLQIEQKLPDFKKSPVLARIGDRFRYRPVDREEFEDIKKQCEMGTYRYNIDWGAKLDLNAYEASLETKKRRRAD
ncbi:MAG: carboxyltransferase domain-containing protein [Eubacterium sp.]|nr:carboxyltransferase domain-containing protein [Eubacterium sp.]